MNQKITNRSLNSYNEEAIKHYQDFIIPVETDEQENYLNYEENYIVSQKYKLPIPKGIDTKILDLKYIKLISIIDAVEKFHLNLRPYSAFGIT